MKELLLLVTIVLIGSCSGDKTTTEKVKLSTRTFIESIVERDGVSGSLVLDSSYVWNIERDSLSLVILKYHNSHNTQYLVLTLENFPSKHIPFYIFEGEEIGNFDIEEHSVNKDILLVQMSFGKNSSFRRMKIEFNLNSQGLFDDWTVTEINNIQI